MIKRFQHKRSGIFYLLFPQKTVSPTSLRMQSRITKFEKSRIEWKYPATLGIAALNEMRIVDYSRIFRMRGRKKERGEKREDDKRISRRGGGGGRRRRRRRRKAPTPALQPQFACIFEREKKRKKSGCRGGGGGERRKGRKRERAVARGTEMPGIGTVKRVSETSCRIGIGIEIGSRQRTIGWDVSPRYQWWHWP